MKKYLEALRIVRCSMRTGEIIFLFKSQDRVWYWLFGHGGNLSPAEMFPTWLCHPSAGILMAVRDEDTYRDVFAVPTWYMESRNSECRFPEMDYLEPWLL